MKVRKISPRGYCHGVVDAINIVVNAVNDPTTPRPITILGELIHNSIMIEELKKIDVKTIDSKDKTRLELLDEVSQGTIIFTAHGVSEKVIKKAIEKGLNIIDATCSDVKKTHVIIKEALAENKVVLYIGKNKHPETESCVSISDEVILIENIDDVNNLDINQDLDILITNQTTLSLLDIVNISDAIMKKYPKAQFYDEICDSTKIRQEAVINQTKDVDLLIVVGDPKSNNSQKLATIAKEANNINAILISSVFDIKDFDFDKYKIVGVTSGASTPTAVTNQVIKFLEHPENKDEILNASIKILPRRQHD